MNIVEKIKKLLALAANESATEGEAENALRMATELMLKHGVRQRDVEEDEVVIGFGHAFTGYKDGWQHYLAITVGELYGSRCIFKRGTRHFIYVGRPEVRDATEITFEFIVAQINKFYRVALPPGLSKRDRATWRRDFKKACSSRICHRIDSLIDEQSTDKGAVALGCTALVVLTHKQRMQDEIDGFFGDEKMTNHRVTISQRLTEATLRGRVAGDNVQIQTEVR